MATEQNPSTPAEGELWARDEVLAALRHTLVGSNRMHGSLAAELGINPTGLSALNHLAEMPGLTPKQLSELLGITTGSTTGATDALWKAGFLTREPHPEDRRSVVLHLTPAGRHAIGWVLEQYETALSVAYERHPDSERPQLARFLEDLAVALGENAASRAGGRA
ncbi:MarR family winged helix-turn-helix transcriptional regulator [Terracoccus luteus]|jgi:DNA-binding MarR family transcriptional regulator|uniref:DNA-binding MarR family transcriptional regulator n=1 Tax=Terracoccus luteus TaxID=53356 RepID=A0A495XUW6_9MICO|nr:MarR family winged helix-turn-helix transcriptional regulator [Terracoccus luteus]MBB2985597.1 DNA-binding MarR family transcriptional regulator [Terracoccus luteus]MCP2171249.1 DNA-binding MarR family transcriptional regulator [Terracoccus luteus]RKT78350.1 DNA-binding MarR family transcriptional regulator [Terracoccus luteus]